jgi:FKBP-type peptidyl-prolyl cis-trans isomerase
MAFNLNHCRKNAGKWRGYATINAMQKFLSAISCLSLALFFSAAAMAQQTSTAPAAKPATPTGSASTSGAAPASPYTTDQQKASYAIGQNIGNSLKHDGLDVDPNVVSQGLKDALTGAKSQISEAESQEAMTKLRNEVMARKQEQMQEAGEANKKAGEQFLAANKAKEGVVALPDGLQYKVLKEGTGPKPKATDSVVVNYRGTLIDGKEFDSSEKHGEPAKLEVNKVIKGWTEALQLMPVGSKWELVLPPDLAYGANGAGGVIPPNATLIFDIELLSIKGQ